LNNYRRKILFIIPTSSSGGAELVIINLLRHFDRSKFVMILAVVDMNSEVYLNDFPVDVDLINLRGTRVRFALLKIMRLIWQIKPKVVFSTLGYLNLSLAILKP
jgi:hypothetical protein